MAFTSLIPWRKRETRIPVRREEENSLLDLRNQMNRMFDTFFERAFDLSPFFGDFSFTGDFMPQMDFSENDKEYNISVDLPGMEPEDVQISLERNALILSGEKRTEKEEKNKRYYRLERSYGSFRRVIPIPDEVEENKIDATFKNGVLKITLPKTAEAQRSTKRISIKKE